MKAWFCYEKDFAERFVPVIYYDELPASDRGRTQVVEVTTEPRDSDGELSIWHLQSKYPLKEQENADDPRLSQSQRKASGD